MDLKIREFELQILHFFRDKVAIPFLDVLAQIITFFGEEYIIIAVIFIAFFIIDKHLGKTIAYVVLTNMLINNSIKGIIKYPRPFVYDPTLNASRIQTATGFSFPSGHAQNASSAYFAFAYNNNFNNRTKKIIWIVSIVLVTLVSLSRIYLGVHYPKDVIVGVVLGIGCMLLCSYLMNRYKDNFKGMFLLLLITFILFTPFIFIFYRKEYTDFYIFRDFYLAYGLYAGCLLGFFLDEKFLNYSTTTSFIKRIIRLVVATAFALLIKVGFKYLFLLFCPDGSIFLDMLRYFLMAVVVLFVVPLIFKNNLFKD